MRFRILMATLNPKTDERKFAQERTRKRVNWYKKCPPWDSNPQPTTNFYTRYGVAKNYMLILLAWKGVYLSAQCNKMLCDYSSYEE